LTGTLKAATTQRFIAMNKRRIQYNKDYYSGALMLLIGLFAIWSGIGYQVGTLGQMGPGFFPVSIGVLLSLTGAVIAIQAARSAPVQRGEALPPEWRGWICIVLSIVAFVVLGRYGGLLPATFAVVFISALGDRQNTLVSAAALAAAISVVSVVVFWWALKVQFPLFQWG
jgi:hypothetical protein